MIWRFLNTGFHTGTFNMTLDEQLALELNEGSGMPTLRLYGWRPYTLSLGFHQTEDEFDLDRLHQEHIDVVRRPTGGRAILHAHELTYSVVMRCREMRPKEIYRFVNEGLLRGLHNMGIDATFATGDPNFRLLYRQPASIPCFASSAKNEIQFHGKKIVGSAQRRYGEVVLQHGSLLLGPQHRKIVDFIAPHLQEMHTTLARELDATTIEAENILNRSVSFDETAECIAQGCEHAWNSTFINDNVPQCESIAFP